MRVTLYCSLLAFAIVPALTTAIPQCPLSGPDYVAPKFPLSSYSIEKATSSIRKTLETAVRSGTSDFGDIDASQTSFSIGIYSLNVDEPLFTFHHDGPKLPKPEIGVSKVDSNTIYRIGSVSKLLSVYLYLATVGDKSFSDPVTKYIPEFADYAARHSNPEDDLDLWDFRSMTVGALASQLSGLPRGTIGNFGVNQQLEQLGLPKLPKLPGNITGADCPDSYHSPCTRAGFLQNIILQKPTGPAYYRAAYSNAAYGVLALVLENITGQAFPDLFKQNLIEPLKLSATYYAAPPTPRNGIIPFNNSVSHWTTNIRNQSAAGNYYSSINDMERLGRAMMNSTLLSPALTRRWMSPRAFLSRRRSAVGAPWELFDANKNVGKQAWLYTKRGDIGAYSTNMALMPDWRAGFTILTAGLAAPYINEPLSNIVATSLAPALEEAAKEEARRAYPGTYCDAKKNSTVVLDVDEGPGIAIRSWTVEGTDVLGVISEYFGVKRSVLRLRLYPNGLTSSVHDEVIGYRAVFYTNSSVTATHEGEILSLGCSEWSNIDSIVFGRYGLDSFSVTTDTRTGKALAVSPRAFGEALPRCDY